MWKYVIWVGILVGSLFLPPSGQAQNAAVAVNAAGDVHIANVFAGDLVLGDTTLLTLEEEGLGAFIAKLDATGNVLWARQVGGIGYSSDGITSVAGDAAGGGYVGGYFGPDSLRLGPGLSVPPGGFVAKYDEEGQFEWVSPVNENIRSVFDLAADGAGGVYVTGDAGGFESPRTFLTRFDAQGHRTWYLDTRGNNASNMPLSLGVGANGHLAFTGYVNGWALDLGDVTLPATGLGRQASDVLVGAVDGTGNPAWLFRAEGGGRWGSGVGVDARGNTYVTGRFSDTLRFDASNVLPGDGEQVHMFVVRIDAEGRAVWAKRVEGLHPFSEPNLVVEDNGTLHVAATTLNFGDEDRSGLFLAGYAPGGELIYTRFLENAGTGFLARDALAIDAEYLYIVGGAGAPADWPDVTALLGAEGNGPFVGKLPLNALVSTETGPSRPSSVRLLGNYPNPFRSSTTVRFALPTPSAVRLSVYDVLGREVAVVLDESMSAGLHTATFDGTALPSGVYLLRLETASGVQVQRIVLQQ